MFFYVNHTIFTSQYELGQISSPFSDTVVSSETVFQVRLRCDITAKGVGEVAIP